MAFIISDKCKMFTFRLFSAIIRKSNANVPYLYKFIISLGMRTIERRQRKQIENKQTNVDWKTDQQWKSEFHPDVYVSSYPD